MSKRPSMPNRLIRNNLIQHGLFWIISYYLLYRLFRYSEETTRTDLIYTFLFHLSLVPVFYGNTRLLIPQLFRKGRYIWYLIGTFLLLVVGVALNQFIFRYGADWIFPGYYFISYYGSWEILQFMGAYWALSTLLKLSRSWFLVREQEKRIRQLEQDRSMAELRALKAQLDPHFLFNSLNNIYSLALYEDKRTPEALLTLSNNMRYVLYECNAETVPLQREIDQVRDYLSLFQMRSDLEVEVDLRIMLSQKKEHIQPLLILPLIENACKHSRPNNDGDHFIRIAINQEDHALSVRCANSYHEKAEKGPGGVGLENLRRRLELLFPGTYSLDIQSANGVYTVHLHCPTTSAKL